MKVYSEVVVILLFVSWFGTLISLGVFQWIGESKSRIVCGLKWGLPLLLILIGLGIYSSYYVILGEFPKVKTSKGWDLEGLIMGFLLLFHVVLGIFVALQHLIYDKMRIFPQFAKSIYVWGITLMLALTIWWYWRIMWS